MENLTKQICMINCSTISFYKTRCVIYIQYSNRKYLVIQYLALYPD